MYTFIYVLRKYLKLIVNYKKKKDIEFYNITKYPFERISLLTENVLVKNMTKVLVINLVFVNNILLLEL